MKTIISSGGLGDSFIVWMKIQEWLKVHPGQKIKWKHYESNEIVPKLIDQLYKNTITEAIFDPNYIETIKKEWSSENLYLNTSIDGQFNFPAKDDGLKNPFILNDISWFKRDTIIIQQKAGAKQNRNWPFDIKILFSLLKNEKTNLLPLDQNIDKTALITQADCKLMISPSGFWTYFALANKIPTIYLSESEEHEKHYFHPDWKPYKFKMKYGSMKEVMDGLRHFGYKI